MRRWHAETNPQQHTLPGSAARPLGPPSESTASPAPGGAPSATPKRTAPKLPPEPGEGGFFAFPSTTA